MKITTSRKLLAATALLFFAGCGGSDTPPLGEVTGTIMIDGKPASGVRVIFKPDAGGRNSEATTDESGNYELVYSADHMGAIVGKHQASVVPGDPPVDSSDNSGSAVLKSPTGVPKDYLTITKNAEVNEGGNTIDLAWP